MQVPPEQGALLALLIETLGAERVVELGTFTARGAFSPLAAPPWLCTRPAPARAPRASR